MSTLEPASAEARPPSVLKATLLIAALEGRRFLNRRPLKRNAKTRGGTRRKGAPAKLLLAVVSVVLAINVLTQTSRLVQTIALAVERAAQPDVVLVSRDTLEALDDVLAERRPVGTLWRSRDELLRPVFEDAARDEELHDDAAVSARADEVAQIFAQRGRAAFRARTIRDEPWPSRGLWFQGKDPRAMLDPMALVCLLLAFSVVGLGVVGSDRDLARSDATLEWWFTFPVETRGLLLARLLGSALMSPFSWLVLVPFFTVVFWCAGQGLALGALLAVCATLYLCLLSASLRIACEATLQRLFAPRRIARIQAALEVFASLPFLLLLAASSPAGARYLVALAPRMPGVLIYGPLTLPVAWTLPDARALGAAAAALGACALAILGAVFLGSAMLKNGLVTANEPVAGARTRSTNVGGTTRSLLQLVARRELLALVRDPGRAARVLIVPLGMVGLFALTDPAIFRAIISKPEHASAAAFSVGVVVLSGGGLVSLANEGAGLWLLYAVPHGIDRILVCRAALWAGLAAATSAFVLMGLALVAHTARFFLSVEALLALVGVVIFGFVSVALGALGTDVLEPVRVRRLQPYVPQLFLLLAGMYTFGLYSDSAWVEFVELSLSSLFALALWQKLRDHSPYFLDPSEAPPPRISVSDGIFAAQTFFVLQGLIGLVLIKLRVATGIMLVGSFAGAGLLTACGALYALKRVGIPVFEAVGLRSEHARAPRALLLGFASGALAGGVAVLYQLALQASPWLRELIRSDEQLVPSSEELPFIAGIAVFAAPVFEELIFRGLLYRGMRRALAPWPSALASALVFAVVHPPGSFVPVFSMAVLAALVFERAGLLLAPIVAHMTYNAIVVSLTLGAP